MLGRAPLVALRPSLDRLAQQAHVRVMKRLGPQKTIEPGARAIAMAIAKHVAKAGANLRLERKLLFVEHEAEMRSWLVDPAESDEEEEHLRAHCV